MPYRPCSAWPAGSLVQWDRPFDHRPGEGKVLGLAPGAVDRGDCFLAVHAPNGVVHVRQSVLRPYRVETACGPY